MVSRSTLSARVDRLSQRRVQAHILGALIEGRTAAFIPCSTDLLTAKAGTLGHNVVQARGRAGKCLQCAEHDDCPHASEGMEALRQ